MVVSQSFVTICIFYSVFLSSLLMCISMDTRKFTVCTYNSRGHAPDRIEYMKDLLNQCDILFVQEHWYLESNLLLLEKELENVKVYGISGMDEKKLCKGRPFGGCAFICKNNANCIIEPINSDCSRLCACTVRLGDGTKLLLLNVYMPCDTSYDIDNHIEFLEVLQHARSIIDSVSDTHFVILGGDMNTDLHRTNSLHCSSLKEFCQDEGLCFCCDSYVCNVDYTYENVNTTTESIIDHFILSENMFSHMWEYFSVHCGQNLSDHAALFLKLNINLDTVPVVQGDILRNRLSWNKASADDIAQYCNLLNEYLSDIEIPLEALSCCNVLCTHHNVVIDKYYNDIVKACNKAASKCIPKCKPTKAKAGWTEYVAPFKDKAILWRYIWNENGKPRQGWVYEIMIKARLEYKRISRWVIRNQNKIKAEKWQKQSC